MFFALSVAIFGWGLQYKLSLYKPHMVTHAMPEAKLLSRDESQSQVGGGSIDQRDPVSTPRELVFAAGLFFSAYSATRLLGVSPTSDRELERPWISQPSQDRLFFRPPPALA